MMKTLIKTVGLLCVLLTFPMSGNAQWRFGLEAGPGCNSSYEYDYKGSFTGEDKTGYVFGQMNFMMDYLLPRKWTPNYLALSVRAGLGLMLVEDDTYTQSIGVDIPLEVEAKYLLTNRFRIYFNGGVTPFVNVLSTDTWAYYNDDIYGANARRFVLGYQFGLGFEFSNFRIGYKHFCMTNTLGEVDYGNEARPVHAVSVGFWFGGSRLLKKSSTLKAY